MGGGTEDFQDDDLYEHHHFVAAKGQEPLRMDKFLMNFIEHITRNKIQQAAKSGYILVNGKAEKPNYKIKAGDDIKIMFHHPPAEFLLEPECIPLNIAYEDQHLLVVSKPPGLVVHPGHGNYRGTLVNGVLYHLQNQTSPIPINSDNRPLLVHRIDKDTSGLLVIAKTQPAIESLAFQFSQKTTKREYIALVWGNLKDDQGTIRGNIGRDPKNRLQMRVFEDGSSGKEAVTHYTVLERFNYTTLVSCRLETGRTHQIRAHFRHLGHPLFNDERYGGDQILKGTLFSKYKQFVENCFAILPRQALHAKTLGFRHPVSDEEMLFSDPLPDDMKNCIDKWRHYTRNKPENAFHG